MTSLLLSVLLCSSESIEPTFHFIKSSGRPQPPPSQNYQINSRNAMHRFPNPNFHTLFLSMFLTLLTSSFSLKKRKTTEFRYSIVVRSMNFVIHSPIILTPKFLWCCRNKEVKCLAKKKQKKKDRKKETKPTEFEGDHN